MCSIPFAFCRNFQAEREDFQVSSSGRRSEYLGLSSRGRDRFPKSYDHISGSRNLYFLNIRRRLAPPGIK